MKLVLLKFAVPGAFSVFFLFFLHGRLLTIFYFYLFYFYYFIYYGVFVLHIGFGDSKRMGFLLFAVLVFSLNDEEFYSI